jgi:hypothetical protein
MAEHRMLCPADGGPGTIAAPADHDEVRAVAATGQHPGRVVLDDILQDGHGGVPVLPGLESLGQVPVRLRAALESAADRALRPGGFIDVDLLPGESEGSLSTSISGNSRGE